MLTKSLMVHECQGDLDRQTDRVTRSCRTCIPCYAVTTR